jgi:ASPIC and UnbV/FG-GAP-like repeat
MNPRILRPLVGIALIAAAVVVSAVWIDRRGVAFYQSGRDVVSALDTLAAAIARDDATGIGQAYASSFSGARLGLATRDLADAKDGVRHYRFRSGAAGIDRAAAVSDWCDYRDSFASIETTELHLDRLEQWRGKRIVATIRFEAIGRPKGEPQGGVDRATLRMTFDRTPQGLRVADASLVSGERVIASQPQFVNVAHAAGVDFPNRYYPAFLDQPLRFGMIRYGPGGIAAVDVDNDGFYDLFVPDGVASRLLRNGGDGTFEDITTRAGLSGLDGVSVGVFADYDNDGYKDLFVSRTFRHNQLFHNNGDGTFADVTARSGIGDDCCTTVASWGDYDNDGRLDLYVGRYLDPRTKIPTTFYARNGEGNRLYHNNGDGTFSDVTANARVGDTGLCLGSVWGDYDDDGFPDLYVANDFGRKTLYHNNRDGTFSDVTIRAGALDYGAGMSASMGDFDNDGHLDLYVANIRSEHAWFADSPTVWRFMVNSLRQGVWTTDMPLYFQILRQSGRQFADVFREMASGNTLLRNRGDGTFEDVTSRAGANPIGWFWGSAFADFDNDGWLDIYSADGWVYNDRGTEMELDFLNAVVSDQREYKKGTFFDPGWFGGRSWHGYERNRQLRNNGDGTFLEVARAAGTDLVLNSRGIAVADFWNRGVLDIAVAASADRHALLKNELAAKHHWLGVELVGTRSNRDAVGARVYARVGRTRQMRELALGDGYGSQNSLRQYFGLGSAASVDELIVRWPRSGVTQTFTNVRADQIVQVTEAATTGAPDSTPLVEKHFAAAAAESRK